MTALVAATAAAATGAAAWAAVGACVLALVPTGARWLRVAQREHYVPDAVSRFALRWWTAEPADAALGAAALACVVLSGIWPLVALGSAAAVALGPRRLGIRGRTSPLVATRRLKTLAAVALGAEAALIGIGVGVGAPAPFAAAGLVALPALVDGALYVTAPLERRLSGRFVAMAERRLRRVGPTVVAITGSYGKTSTKNYVAHLVSGQKAVVATPASFNNRGGLARSVNEHLAEGTEVFVAEMGTYGPGEIRDLCRWCPPDVAVLTAIGPVHLERFGTEDAIVKAKSEITERPSLVVVNADDGRLAGLARSVEAERPGVRVVRCSAEDESADVCVRPLDGTVRVLVDGRKIGDEVALRPGIQPTNVACALAVALHLGVPADVAVARVPTLPAVANRLTSDTTASGVHVIDDTFNSNPAGARAALGLLARSPGGGRRVLVTPGMVELGSRQADENRTFAAAACDVADELVVVGLTNRKALLEGAGTRRPVVVVRTREEAVAWVRANLGPGDAVLYENDLPDHYP